MNVFIHSYIGVYNWCIGVNVAKFNYFEYKEKRIEKLSPREQEDLLFDLINAFAQVNTPLDAAFLVHDIFTESEVMNLAKRLRIAKLLLNGKTHEEIVQELHCSFATITKVRIWLDNAGYGIKRVIKKLPKRRKGYISKRIPGIGYGLPQILLSVGSLYLKEKEQQGLVQFLKAMRAKAETDRDFREEVSADFMEHRRKKRKQE